MPLRRIFDRAAAKLIAFDIRANNRKHAQDVVPFARRFSFEPHEYKRITFHSRARIGVDYDILHTMLLHCSGGNLRGKRVLHLGGSTGVYAHFLNEVEGMRAETIDTDFISNHLAKSRRGVKATVHSAIPEKHKRTPMHMPKGVWMRETEKALPFPSNHFDYLIRDHFLFADYHKGISGFELKEGSIEESLRALQELNRILRTNGRLLVAFAHPSMPEMKLIKEGRVIHGFVVEKIYDNDLTEPTDKAPPENYGAGLFVLRKIRDVKRDKIFFGGRDGKNMEMAHRI